MRLHQGSGRKQIDLLSARVYSETIQAHPHLRFDLLKPLQDWQNYARLWRKKNHLLREDDVVRIMLKYDAALHTALDNILNNDTIKEFMSFLDILGLLAVIGEIDSPQKNRYFTSTYQNISGDNKF